MIGDLPLIFVNSEPMLDFPRPIMRKVIDIGGLSMKEGKSLDEVGFRITISYFLYFPEVEIHPFQKNSQCFDLLWQCRSIQVNEPGIQGQYCQSHTKVNLFLFFKYNNPLFSDSPTLHSSGNMKIPKMELERELRISNWSLGLRRLIY